MIQDILLPRRAIRHRPTHPILRYGLHPGDPLKGCARPSALASFQGGRLCSALFPDKRGVDGQAQAV